MFRHVVMFRWSPGGRRPTRRTAVAAALGAAARGHPDHPGLPVRSDAAVNDGNFDFVVVADFDDVAGYLAYRDHPAHQAVIAEHIAPILAERAAVQYPLEG